MTRTTYKALFHFVFSAIIVIAVSTSHAAPLSGHVDAFGNISGTVPFNNGVGLSGSIEYAVFTANDFNANFAGLGYVPGDALVYTYQVFVTGTLGVSAEIVGPISNPANTIGTFDIGDVDASSASFTPNARWLFSPVIPSGMSSYGLAYSSPNLPIVGGSVTIDGGTQAQALGLPVPGSIRIPEPGCLFLAVTSIVGSCLLLHGRPRPIGCAKN